MRIGRTTTPTARHGQVPAGMANGPDHPIAVIATIAMTARKYRYNRPLWNAISNRDSSEWLQSARRIDRP